MADSMERRVVKLERSRGVRRHILSAREMTGEELTDLLIEYGLPIRHGMPDEELMPILERFLEEEKRNCGDQ